jgi:hypothetical protein
MFANQILKLTPAQVCVLSFTFIVVLIFKFTEYNIHISTDKVFVIKMQVTETSLNE